MCPRKSGISPFLLLANHISDLCLAVRLLATAEALPHCFAYCRKPETTDPIQVKL